MTISLISSILSSAWMNTLPIFHDDDDDSIQELIELPKTPDKYVKGCLDPRIMIQDKKP